MENAPVKRVQLALCGFICLMLCLTVSTDAASRSKSKLKVEPRERGQVVKKDVPGGSYQEYIPARLADPPRVLVIVHGTLGEGESALALADRFIRRWIPLAEEKGLILVAPAFDQQNFGGFAGPGGGYRGLFGRIIGADEFVHQIVDQYKTLSDDFDGRFYLFGHSAGGQFAGRYVVLHPDRILGAVVESAGSFAYPDPAVPWGGGMGRLRRKMRWPGSDKDNVIDIAPDPAGWVKAGGLLITVLVGADDVDPAAEKNAKISTGHVAGARSWIEAMKKLCQEQKQAFHMRLVIVPGVGHNSSALTPMAMRAIKNAIAFNSRRPASRPATSRPTK